MSSSDSALTLDPNNPILVREEMKAQKVSLFPFFPMDMKSLETNDWGRTIFEN